MNCPTCGKNMKTGITIANDKNWYCENFPYCNTIIPYCEDIIQEQLK